VEHVINLCSAGNHVDVPILRCAFDCGYYSS